MCLAFSLQDAGASAQTSVWGRAVVKSNAPQVIVRAAHASRRAEVLLICNSGATSPVDMPTFLTLIAWCAALHLPRPAAAPIRGPSAINRCYSLFQYEQLFSCTSGLLLCLVLSLYFWFCVLLTYAGHTNQKMPKMKPVRHWSSTNGGFWLIPVGSHRWILYISIQYLWMNRNPTWTLEMPFSFQLIFQLTKSLPIHSLKPMEVKWNWPLGPVSVSLLLTPSHKSAIVGQPSI